MFWPATCFADINIAKKGLLLTAIPWNICKFLLREMAVSSTLYVHLANTVYLVEMEFKLFLVNIPPPVSVKTNTEVYKNLIFTFWLKTEVRFQNWN